MECYVHASTARANCFNIAILYYERSYLRVSCSRYVNAAVGISRHALTCIARMEVKHPARRSLHCKPTSRSTAATTPSTATLTTAPAFASASGCSTSACLGSLLKVDPKSAPLNLLPVEGLERRGGRLGRVHAHLGHASGESIGRTQDLGGGYLWGEERAPW